MFYEDGEPVVDGDPGDLKVHADSCLILLIVITQTDTYL